MIRDMKTGVVLRYWFFLTVVALSTVFVSCGSRYQEPPFGGMNGRVQKVTVWHLMPEVWHANERGTDVMYMNASGYDVNGYEICSALMDSAGRVQTEAESLFENGVCVRSIQKGGGRVMARINLVSSKRGTLEYKKEENGRVVQMVVKESSFGRKHKSVVTEDGKTTTISVIQTDSKGYPVKITVTDPQTGEEVIQTNTYDEKNNIIEKHVSVKGEEKDEITYTEYFDFDEKGNWKEARTFNRNRLPVEVLVREIEYW